MDDLGTDRWRRLESLVHAALARPASERAAFLANACGDDEDLRREAESLIESAESAGAFLETPAAGTPLIGRQLGAYRLEQLVGAGGMGEVYRAKDPRLGRDVAVKILPAAWVADAQRRARFEREARAIAALNHPHICTIHDVGRDDGIDYLVMEFVDGESLAARLARGSLPLDQALAHAIEIAEALDCAHRQGVVHRDLKPGNVMLTSAQSGGSRGVQAKLVDFGLARMLRSPAAESTPQTTTASTTATGAVLGTPQYMAPEQIEGRTADARTDVFAFGALLFEMLTGRPAFDGATAPAIMAAILRADPPSLAAVQPSLPRSLERLVHACLAKDPADRVSSMHDVLLQLRGIAEEVRPPAQARAAAGRARGWRRTIAMAALVISLVGSAAAWRLWPAAPILTERDTILIADFVNTTGDAVFEGVLKQALAISLEQSTFMSTMSEARIDEALKLMSRSADERLTRAIAQEICQRQTLKAFIAGDIAPIGREYAISLEAVHGQTGDVLARALGQARTKEEVITAVGIAASRMREQLGESLASIQKGKPLQIATTSSLEALRAFSIGLSHFAQGNYPEAVDAHTRATALDPSFAKAWDSLVPAYSNLGLLGPAEEAAKRAYALKDRVSEGERLVIEARYQEVAERNLYAAVRHYGTLIAYPNSVGARWGSVAMIRLRLGEPDKTIESAREALNRDPSLRMTPIPLARALLSIGKPEEARAAIDRYNVDEFRRLRVRLEIAHAMGDTAELERTIESAGALQRTLRAFQREVAGFEGRAREAQELAGPSAAVVPATAVRYAAFGDCPRALAEAGRALLDSPESAEAALAMSWCRNSDAAERAVSALLQRYPNGTLENGLWIPLIQAASVLEREPREALRLLEPVRKLEGSNEAAFRPQYLRGLAHLAANQPGEAATEFQKILGQRGLAPLSPLYPLAHVGLARASKAAGNVPKARQAYEAFFSIWKKPDPDVPILVAARREYAALK